MWFNPCSGLHDPTLLIPPKSLCPRAIMWIVWFLCLVISSMSKSQSFKTWKRLWIFFWGCFWVYYVKKQDFLLHVWGWETNQKPETFQCSLLLYVIWTFVKCFPHYWFKHCSCHLKLKEIKCPPAVLIRLWNTWKSTVGLIRQHNMDLITSRVKLRCRLSSTHITLLTY